MSERTTSLKVLHLHLTWETLAFIFYHPLPLHVPISWAEVRTQILVGREKQNYFPYRILNFSVDRFAVSSFSLDDSRDMENEGRHVFTHKFTHTCSHILIVEINLSCPKLSRTWLIKPRLLFSCFSQAIWGACRASEPIWEIQRTENEGRAGNVRGVGGACKQGHGDARRGHPESGRAGCVLSIFARCRSVAHTDSWFQARVFLGKSNSLKKYLQVGLGLTY